MEIYIIDGDYRKVTKKELNQMLKENKIDEGTEIAYVSKSKKVVAKETRAIE